MEDSLPSVQAEPEIRQITLFDIAPKTDTYEDTDGSDHDNLFDKNTTEPEQLPFKESDRIYYRGQLYEILRFLHDGRTVEIGEISQLQNLAGFKIRERVPLSEIADSKLLKNSYSEGESAEMVVGACLLYTSQTPADVDKELANRHFNKDYPCLLYTARCV